MEASILGKPKPTMGRSKGVYAVYGRALAMWQTESDFFVQKVSLHPIVHTLRVEINPEINQRKSQMFLGMKNDR